MRILVFSTHGYDRDSFASASRERPDLEFDFTPVRLEARTAQLAAGFDAVCCFVEDEIDAVVLEALAARGTCLVLLRCTGYNNVDLPAAERLGMSVMRVSRYSPYAVAEFAAGLILTLNRKIHRAYNRVREGNFRLGGLLGFDLHGKTAGIVGTGRIGTALAHILNGFGCKLLAYDPHPSAECIALGVRYVDLSELLAESRIVSLHLPLNPQTRHIIDANALADICHGAMLINTSRGALVDASAVIDALKDGRLGAVGLDVYEEEGDMYFTDHSDQIIDDDVFARLLTFPNVVVTGHQAFFTSEAMKTIAQTTLRNIDDHTAGRDSENRLRAAA
ncbi:MAG TPA: 2-hydroxyacid dehydrogenase, partial [Mycobacterium sp.]|nr:2-hydroxyacid dehydrogenase [Mycobacterium sp.]